MIVELISRNGKLTRVTHLGIKIGQQFVVIEKDDQDKTYRLSNHYWVNQEDCKLINN
jgi:hypothetical protein